MTTYIIWNKSYDAAFQAVYLDVTGESIQGNPQENDAQSHFVVGSSRITPAQMDVLLNNPEFLDLYIGEELPVDWVPRLEEEG